jgi:GT2 family glycosyltransferase
VTIPSDAVDVSIVIVNWNTYKLVADCITSVTSTVRRYRTQIFVVDNSQDSAGRQRWAQELPRSIRIILNNRNEGFAAACNQAIQFATGRHLLLLNPDTTLRPGAIENMLTILEEEPAVGILGAQLLNSDGGLQVSAYRIFPSVRGALLDATGLLWLMRRFRTHVRRRTVQPRYEVTGWVKGACMVVRREVVQRIGLMDEHFFLYCEDADWCYRAREDGWRVAIAPACLVEHVGQASARKIPDTSISLYYNSYLLFVAKHGGRGRFGCRLRIATVLLRLAAFNRMLAVLLVGREEPDRKARALAYLAFLSGRSTVELLGAARNQPTLNGRIEKVS